MVRHLLRNDSEAGSPNGARAVLSASDDVRAFPSVAPWQGGLRTNELHYHRSESARPDIGGSWVGVVIARLTTERSSADTAAPRGTAPVSPAPTGRLLGPTSSRAGCQPWFSNRSAVGAGAAPPQFQHWRGRQSRTGAGLELVQSDSTPVRTLGFRAEPDRCMSAVLTGGRLLRGLSSAAATPGR
jgi:hypothetical protein